MFKTPLIFNARLNISRALTYIAPVKVLKAVSVSIGGVTSNYKYDNHHCWCDLL